MNSRVRSLLACLTIIGQACSVLAQDTSTDHVADADVNAATFFEEEIDEAAIDESDRDHWSFQSITRPRLPSIKQADWPSTAIDYFVLHDLEQNDLQPALRASRTTLLRRLKFNLLGLPPTPDEVIRFAENDDPNAYARLVDRMLSSPTYGERWAQFWLDLARFAETDGFEHDKVRADAWRYRQWVVDAFNDDTPYDEFVRMQLAGDLVAKEHHAIATMFCMAGPDMPDINEQDLRRHDKMNELTSTVGAVLLGLQMHCAQCHDHKYDPISQADFFRLRGIFESSVPAMTRDRPVVQLSAQPQPIAPWIYLRGELTGRGPRLNPRPPRVVSSPLQADSFNTHPRLAFVDWLFANENPLTARVIANRIWQQHFGKSLSENPSDFGVIASGPSHPQLLDWLATELRHNDWSIKDLHRTILLSSTYQQASRPTVSSAGAQDAWDRTVDKDPDNKLYGRFPRRRLEGEAIRDALLSVSCQLNSQYGGPSVMPSLPSELRSTLLKGQWTTSANPQDHVRRSIYVFARRNMRFPIFDVFDRPDAGSSSARRDRSTTAIQSLQMLNGELAYQSAVNLRDRLLSNQPEHVDGNVKFESIVEQLFLTTLARRPSRKESDRFLDALKKTPGQLRENLRTACLAILNASEFVYVD